MNTSVEQTKLAPPILNPGEVYAGALIKPDGTGHHIILLSGDEGSINYPDAVEWAKKAGGSLPARIEQEILFTHLPGEFTTVAWYWADGGIAGHGGRVQVKQLLTGSREPTINGTLICARSIRREAV